MTSINRFEFSSPSDRSNQVSNPFVALDLHEEYAQFIPSTNETAASFDSEIDFSNFDNIYGNSSTDTGQALSLPEPVLESAPRPADANSVPLLDLWRSEAPLNQSPDIYVSILPSLVIEDGPRLFADESGRRETLTPEFFQQLLQAASTNGDARHILRDVVGEKSTYLRHQDPIELAITYAINELPDAKVQLQSAVLSGYRSQSSEDILSVLAGLARNDPEFAFGVREAIIKPALSSSDSSTRHQGTDLLLALADQWTEADFDAALETFQPDQIPHMRMAVIAMPERVREVFRDSLRKSTVENQPEHPLLSLLSAEPVSTTIAARLQLLAVQPQSSGEPVGDSELFRLSLGADRLSRADMELLPPSGIIFPGLRNPAMASLLEQAFPHSSILTIDEAKAPIDTRYLAQILEPDIGPTLKRSTAFDVFARWELDIEELRAPIQQAIGRYGEDTILALERRLALYNSMDGEIKEELTGSREQIAPPLLAGIILNGKLGEPGSIGGFLIDEPPLELKLRTMSDTIASLQREQRLDLNHQDREQKTSLRELRKHTSDGVGALDLLDHAVDVALEDIIVPSSTVAPLLGEVSIRTSSIEQFQETQAEMIRSYCEDRDRFKEHYQTLATLSRRMADLELSEDVYAYEQLNQTGAPQLRRDYLALAMLDTYGVDEIKERAPHVFADLTNGGLTRLKDSGLVKSDQLTPFSTDPAQGFDEAILVLTGLTGNEGGNLDLGIRRNHALAQVDNHPALVKTKAIASRFGEEFSVFSALFEAGQTGTKYEEYVQFVRATAQNIEMILAETTPEEIAEIRQSIIALDIAAGQAQDRETRQQLESRHHALSGMLDILDPQSPGHHSIRAVLEQAQNRDFNADTLTNWAKENGPVIAATALAVAATLASLGAASPLALILVSSAAALGASQVSREMLYQINHHIGDTGFGASSDRSYAGAWVNNHWDDFKGLVQSEEWTGTEQNARELLTSFFSEVATPLTLEYAQNVVLGLVSAGVVRFGQAGFEGLSPQWVRALVKNPQASSTLAALGSPGASPTARAFTRQWFAVISKETGGEIIEELEGEGLQTIGERALNDVGLGGPATSILFTISMSLLHGKAKTADHPGNYAGSVDGGIVTLHENTSADVLSDLTGRGFRVAETERGTFNVSSYQSPNTIVEIDFTNDPLRLRVNHQRRPYDSMNHRTDGFADNENGQFGNSLLNRERLEHSVYALHNVIDNLPDVYDEAVLEMDLSDALVDLAKEFNLPLPILRVRSDDPALAWYGDGGITINRRTAKQAHNKPAELIRSVLHELTHLEQDTLIIRRVADILEVGDSVDAQTIEKVKARYFELTAYKVNDALVADVLDIRRGKSLEPIQASRADELAQSFQDLANGEAEAQVLEEEIKSLKNDLDQIKTINGAGASVDAVLGSGTHERQSRIAPLFQGETPDHVLRALDALDEAEKTRKDVTAKEIDLAYELEKALADRIFGLQSQVFQTYSNRPHELEAHKIDRLVRTLVEGDEIIDLEDDDFVDMESDEDQAEDRRSTEMPAFDLKIHSRRPVESAGEESAPNPWYASSLGAASWEGTKYQNVDAQGNQYYRNDDRYWLSPDPQHQVVAVMDGLGSPRHRGSEVAADLVRDALDRRWQEYPGGGSVSDVKDWMMDVVTDAQNQIKQMQAMAKHASDSDLDIMYQATDRQAEIVAGPNMQTTVVVAAVHQDNLVVSWIGDSRAYRFRQGKLLQLTTDDTPPGMPGNVLDNTIGSRSPRLHRLVIDIKEGDRFLVATDGLETLEPEEIESIMQTTSNAEAAQQALFDAVKDKGEKHQDNLTAIVFDVAPIQTTPTRSSQPAVGPHQRDDTRGPASAQSEQWHKANHSSGAPSSRSEPLQKPVPPKLSTLLAAWTNGELDALPIILDSLEQAPSEDYKLKLIEKAAQKLEQQPDYRRRLLVTIANHQGLEMSVRCLALKLLMTQ